MEKHIIPGPLSISSTLPCFKTFAGLKGPSNSFSSLATDLTVKHAGKKHYHHHNLTSNENTSLQNKKVLLGATVGTIFPFE